MILDTSFTILFSKEGLFKVEFQSLFFEVLDCVKLLMPKLSVLLKEHTQANYRVNDSMISFIV